MATRPAYVLVVITANSCGACANFKPNWPQMKRTLQASFPQLDIVEINQPSVSTNYGSAYPSNLNVWGVWFPTILLVPRTEWYGGFIQSASVFNGTYDPSAGKVVNTGRQSLNAATLSAFIAGRAGR